MTSTPPETARPPAWLLLAIGFVVGAATGALVVWALLGRPPPPAAEPTAQEPTDAPAAAPSAANGPVDASRPDAAPDAMPDEPDAGPPDAAVEAGPVSNLDWPTLPRRAPAVVPLRRVLALDDGRWLYAARSEVTRGQWLRLAGQWPGLDRDGPDRPMVNLTAGHAAWFCNELSAREGLEPCYADCVEPRRCKTIPEARRPCTGYRLPTRPEWNAVAKQTDRAAAQTASRRLRLGAPVCAAVDGLDLCDLYGGVWEWTETARRLRGQPTAFRMGGSWDPAHRDVYHEAYQHEMDNPQPFVGLRPVRAVDEPRIAIGALTYDPLARRVSRGAQAVTLEADSALLFERLVRNEGHLPAAGASAAIRSGLGAALAGLGAKVGFEGSWVVLTPPVEPVEITP